MCSSFEMELSVAGESVCFISLLDVNMKGCRNYCIFSLCRVPLTLQQLLYQDLLFFSENGKTDAKSHSSIEFKEASPHTIFAVSTYHRWVLWALKSIQIITKPNKVLHIPM